MEIEKLGSRNWGSNCSIYCGGITLVQVIGRLSVTYFITGKWNATWCQDTLQNIFKKILTAAWVYITCLNQNIDFFKIFIMFASISLCKLMWYFLSVQVLLLLLFLLDYYLRTWRCDKLQMQITWTKQKRRATLHSCFIFHSCQNLENGEDLIQAEQVLKNNTGLKLCTVIFSRFFGPLIKACITLFQMN